MQTALVLKRHFPDFELMLSNLPDYRKRPRYEVRELVMAAIVMFLYRQGSRNQADNTAAKLHWRGNIERIFGIRLPDLDTTNRLFKQMPPEHLEMLKKELIGCLISRKVLHMYRMAGLYYNVAIDATGLYSFDYEPYPGCPFKQYKSGKKVWTASVLEAKIVCINGFSISIASEWIQNPPEKSYDKQDCEMKAFVRLARKLKKFYPRLPVCITADGLYPNNTVFDICKQNDWRFIITLKDGNLKTIWQEIDLLEKITDYVSNTTAKTLGKFRVKEHHKGFKNIEYRTHTLNVSELKITRKHAEDSSKNTTERFVHITDFELRENTLKTISEQGRLRWKIENEGFNEQKNTGYNLKHKYSRTSFNASKNYYQCLQIAHMINQLAYKSLLIKQMTKGNDTLKSHLQTALATLIAEDLQNNTDIQKIEQENKQFRY